MDYQIVPLQNNLVYIKWHSTPVYGSDVQKQFLTELKRLLDGAKDPLFFISDLRSGRIDDVESLQKLGELAKHRKWGGGVSFSQDRSTTALANVFKRIVRNRQRGEGIFETHEKALDYLESLKAGITHGIDWDALLNPKG